MTAATTSAWVGLSVAMFTVANPAVGRQSTDCRELVTAVLAEVATRHWDASVRAAAATTDGGAAEACSRDAEPGIAVERVLARFGAPAIRLLTASHYERMVAEWSGEPVEGVGLTEVLSIDVDESTGRIAVIAPVPGSPASAAGLRAGDVIAALDGASADSLGFTRMMERLRAAAGETVRLAILRNGDAREIPLRSVRLPPLDGLRVERAARDGGRFLVLHLRQFVPGVGAEVRDALETATSVDGVVLDLRGNPGGFVDELVSVAETFLEPGRQIGRLRGPEPVTLRTASEPLGRASLASSSVQAPPARPKRSRGRSRLTVGRPSTDSRRTGRDWPTRRVPSPTGSGSSCFRRVGSRHRTGETC